MAPSGRPATLASVACSFCRKRKRKCDGQQPCSTCVKYNNLQGCEYLADKDRRKWKYDSSFVDFLEVKSDLLANFANELTRSDPAKAAEIRSRLNLSEPTPPVGSVDVLDPKLLEIANPSALEEVLSTAWRVRQDRHGRTAFYGPISGRQQVLEDEELESLIAKDQNGKFDVLLISKEFRAQLFLIFEENFAKYYYISLITLNEVKEWVFPNKNSDKQFLLCSIFAYATVYTNMKHVSNSFLAELEVIALTACRNYLNEFVLQALLILSCFELGMAFDSSSWLFNAMCTSQTQYLGLHLGDRPEFFSSHKSQSIISSSPLKSATFWSVVMQDRLITSVLGRGARIQYFRIMASFYSPKIKDQNNPHYLSELVFTYHSRLWYIHDRSMGQIYSFKAQFLHNSHRLTLLRQGVKSLEVLHKSFPTAIQLQSNGSDPRVLMLHLSYYVVLLLLHRPYLSTSPEVVMEVSVQQCINASLVVDKFNRLHGFSSAPYFASYLILSCATFELFILSNKDDLMKNDASHRLDIFITALLEFGKVWRRGYKDLQVLASLLDKWGVNHFFLRELANMAESSSSKTYIENVETNMTTDGSVKLELDEFNKQFEGNYQNEGWNINQTFTAPQNDNNPQSVNNNDITNLPNVQQVLPDDFNDFDFGSNNPGNFNGWSW